MNPEPSTTEFVVELTRLKHTIERDPPDADECPECAGRGWQGGALRTKNIHGESVVEVDAYEIRCPECGGIGILKDFGLRAGERTAD